MLQLIIKSEKVSRSFKMIGQIIPQFTPKYEEDLKPKVVEFLFGWTVMEELRIE